MCLRLAGVNICALHGAPLGSRGNSSFTPQVIWQSMLRPEWAVRTLLNGGARFRNMEPYAKQHGAVVKSPNLLVSN